LANIFQRNNDKPNVYLFSRQTSVESMGSPQIMHVLIYMYQRVDDYFSCEMRWQNQQTEQLGCEAIHIRDYGVWLALSLPQWARLSRLTPFTSSCFSRSLLHECVLIAHPPTGGCLINNQQAAARPPHLAAFVCEGAARSVFCYPLCREAAD